MQKQLDGGVRIGHDFNNIGKVSEKESVVENYFPKLCKYIAIYV